MSRASLRKIGREDWAAHGRPSSGRDDANALAQFHSHLAAAAQARLTALFGVKVAVVAVDGADDGGWRDSERTIGRWFGGVASSRPAFVCVERASARGFLDLALGAGWKGDDSGEAVELTHTEIEIIVSVVLELGAAAEDVLRRALGAQTKLAVLDEAATPADLGAFRALTCECAFNGRRASFVVAIEATQLAIAPTLTAGPAPDARARAGVRHAAAINERLPVILDVAISDESFTLADIREWRSGVALELEAGPRSQVVASAAGSPLFRCELGQMAGRYSISIMQRLGGGDRRRG